MFLYITQKATRLSHISVIQVFTEIYERLKVKYKRTVPQPYAATRGQGAVFVYGKYVYY